jgi:hypothetical protein
MFMFDRLITTSVSAAMKMLNATPDNFEWLDQEPGVPILIYSSRVGEWFNCVRSNQGIYDIGNCWTNDHVVDEDIPVLHLKAGPNQVLDHRTVHQKSKEEDHAANAAVLEQKKCLEMVQTWVSKHIAFPGFRNITIWTISGHPNILHVMGPQIRYRERKRKLNLQPELPKLDIASFAGIMARFHLVRDMIKIDMQKSATYYCITDVGVKFILEYFNTQAALKTLALGMVQARDARDPLSSFAHSTIFEPKLLGKISELMGPVMPRGARKQ